MLFVLCFCKPFGRLLVSCENSSAGDVTCLFSQVTLKDPRQQKHGLFLLEVAGDFWDADLGGVY